MTTATKEIRRIDILARPKPFHHDFEENRRSVYWIDRAPFTPGPNGTTQVVASQRVRELANPRSISASFKLDRPSAIWPIRKSTLTREPTERLIMLSQPRRQLAVPERSAYTSAPTGFPPQTTVERLMVLSQPRDREDRYAVNETHWGQYFPVSFAAQTTQPSSRLEDLARPKQVHPEFQEERPIQRSVTETALTSIANQHLQKLARPRARTMIIDNYDPYKVSPAAQRTKPTARTELLSLPLPRKQKQKKFI